MDVWHMGDVAMTKAEGTITLELTCADCDVLAAALVALSKADDLSPLTLRDAARVGRKFMRAIDEQQLGQNGHR